MGLTVTARLVRNNLSALPLLCLPGLQALNKLGVGRSSSHHQLTSAIFLLYAYLIVVGYNRVLRGKSISG